MHVTIAEFVFLVDTCEGDDVKVIWKGDHNLQEKKTSEYDSDDISE